MNFALKNYFFKKKNLYFKDVGQNILIKTHKNNTRVIYFYKQKFFRKFSINKKGINKIISESEGYTWYSKRAKIKKKKLIKKFFKNKKISYIDLKEINGVKIKSWKPLKQTYQFLIRFYIYYLKLYPINKYTRIHGDLTLDNIFFKKRSIILIDWEFFKAKKSYYGYDLVYLFLSAVCLPYLNGNELSDKEIILFKNLWKLLIKKKINKKLLFHPFKFFKEKIKKDHELKKSLKLSKSKFFPFIISAIHKKKIMKIIEELKNEK